MDCGCVVEILERRKQEYAEVDYGLAEWYGILMLLCILEAIASNYNFKIDHIPHTDISFYVICRVGSACRMN
jgi:hypothetical protein